MKLVPITLAVAVPALAVPAFSAWPQAPALTLTPFALSGCRGTALQHAMRVPTNRCTGFGLAKSFRAEVAAEPLGQTCVLTRYTGSGCELDMRALDVGGKHGAKCLDTGLPPGWLGGGSEASWSVMWNCNLPGH